MAYISQYPPAYNSTYVKATTAWASGAAYNAANPATSLIGSYTNQCWLSALFVSTNQRWHIDLGSAYIINRIYYENIHNSGGETNLGAKNFTLWGSNSSDAFNDLVYNNDAGWTQLTTNISQFVQHVALNQADPQYILVTNNTPYRYYAIKCADNWGGNSLGLRRIELQVEEHVQKTINSDSHIKVLDNQKIINSDTKIVYQEQKNINSNAEIIESITEQKTIQSDAHIKTLDNQKNISSDTNIIVYHEDIINTDFRTRIEAEKIANLFLATQFGSKINCDFRTKKETDSQVNTDLRFTLYDPSLVSLYPLARTDFHVYIDDVELTDNDLKLDSIKIVHTADNKSNAEFVLLRKHDNLDTPTAITNNNVVKIYLKTKLEFTGRINGLDTKSEEESVRVSCETENITEDYNIVTKELPLTILNNQIHLYDILINDISIDNRHTSDKLVIMGDGKYWTGTTWSPRLSKALIFDTFATAQAYIELRIKNYLNQHNVYINKSNWIYSYEDFKFLTKNVDDVFLDKLPTVENYEQNPSNYKGIVVSLGKAIHQNVIRYDLSYASVNQINDGTFKYQPNYTYFWTIDVNLYGIWAGGSNKVFYNKYIGTSLAPITGDLYEIVGAFYKHQRILDDTIMEMGYYTLGEAPFKQINVKNGKKIPYPRWADHESGLYLEWDNSYNYENYDKQVAALEYDKLKNINGDILPITNTNLDLTIDGYLYYRLKLLTRINISNTTTANIYKNNNGFPVSIKQITIDSSSMKVNLVCDNQKSEYELELIDGLYPDEPKELEAHSRLYEFKFDLPSQENVDISDSDEWMF